MYAPRVSGPEPQRVTRAQALSELEARQRAELPAPGGGRLLERETSRVRVPEGGRLPASEAWLERLYAGELVPREKKPLVVDTRRSWGPLMVSVDERPLVVLDACSQIATLTHGFAHPGMLAAVDGGRFDSCLWSNPDTRVRRVKELEAFVEALKRRAPPGLEHVSVVGAGGAEANEKALRIARLHAPPASAGPRTRVLAFQGGFHGRTWVSLGATWNPKKRGPFELAGYEAVFCEPTLEAVSAALEGPAAQELYAIIIEPMMSEGGERYLAREFFVGLLTLARQHGLPLILDEVQTGFGTGGPFLWWQRLGLGEDEATTPDLITLAKKANLGVVLSRWPDPEKAYTQAPVASVVRGHIQLETADEQAEALTAAGLAARVEALAAAFPSQVENARVTGTTFAFELPDEDARAAFLAQRLHRGLMLYGAGARTLRFRLNARWDARLLDDLFERVAGVLRDMSQAPAAAPQWRAEGYDERCEEPEAGAPRYELRPIREGDWRQIMALERAAYETERQGSEQFLRRIRDGGFGLVAVERSPAREGEPAEQGEVSEGTGEPAALLGFCLGGPLENYRDIAGPDRDPALKRRPGEVFYSADVTVAERARGCGLGRELKRAQIEWARSHGFRIVSGRNRVGDAMVALNRSFGAFTVARMAELFRGEDGESIAAEYYHIPLDVPFKLLPPIEEDVSPASSVVGALVSDEEVDLASGLQQPFGEAPGFMASRELIGPLTSRLNLSNYTTPDVVQYAEHLRLMLPRGTRHMYFTTSRDETVDKGLRCLRLSRPEAQLALSLEGGYVGHVTAAARALSDPRGFGPEFSLLRWPRLPHPADPKNARGVEATVEALDTIARERGAASILGLVVELVGERSGLRLDGDCSALLAAACRRHDIPLVFVETASGGYRNGIGPWAVDAMPPGVVPDMVLWYPGGQLGHVFVGDRYWIGKPLTLISTWDGDELSVIRAHEHLRAAGKLETLAEASESLGALLEMLVPAHFAGTVVGGLGLYRTLTFEDAADAEAVRAACRKRGLVLGTGLPGTLIVAPPLSIDGATIQGLRRRLNAALAAAAGRERAS